MLYKLTKELKIYSGKAGLRLVGCTGGWLEKLARLEAEKYNLLDFCLISKDLLNTFALREEDICLLSPSGKEIARLSNIKNMDDIYGFIACECRSFILNDLVDVLKAGGVVALPTDTVYGLVGCSSSSVAVEKIYRLKNRDRHKPLSIFVSDPEEIKRYGIVNEKVKNFIQNNLDNNTIILEKIRSTDFANFSSASIGMRIPNNTFLQQLILKIGEPLVATSVNRSGEKELNDFAVIIKEFGGELDRVATPVDIGNEPMSLKPSSIYSFMNNQLQKLR